MHVLHSQMSILFHSICNTFMKKNVISRTSIATVNLANPANYKSHEKLYVGAKVLMVLQDGPVSHEDVHSFKTDCLAFYVELATNIRSRFDFNDVTLKFMHAFNPKEALSGDIPNVLPIMAIVSGFQLNEGAVNQEWRMLPVTPIAQSFASLAIEEFWTEVGNLKKHDGSKMFAQIAFVAKSLLSLP